MSPNPKVASNFSVLRSKMIISPDGAWGTKLPNGSFNGIIGMIARREVDAGVTSLSLTQPRSEVADYLFRFATQKYLCCSIQSVVVSYAPCLLSHTGFKGYLEKGALFVTPPLYIVEGCLTVADWQTLTCPNSDILVQRNLLYIRNDMMGNAETFLTFIAPLHPHMWLCIFFTLVVCTLIYALTAKFGRYLKEDHNFDLSLSAMVVIHGIISQGAPYEPQKMSTRVVFLSIFLVGLIIYSSYSACLTSFLAVKRFNLPFIDAKSMMDKSDYKFLTVAGTFYVDVFKVGCTKGRKKIRVSWIPHFCHHA